MNYNLRFTAVLFFVSSFLLAQKVTNPNLQSEELGKVTWLRDYEIAIKLAKKEHKDVLLLFQEVPGCSTCRNYGHQVLSHPFMVEIIENSFVPLAIFNNKGGKDAQVLSKYKEPSWNNPVVRIIDEQGDNVINRISSDYSALGLFTGMKQALLKKGKKIPEYMNLLEQELTTVDTEKAYYKMYCFWTGEKQLGQLPSVLHTESGFINYSEVVEVTFDAKEITKKEMDTYARFNNMTPVSNEKSFRSSPKDIHYYLQHSKYKYLPLTTLQKTKINSALGGGKSTEHLLSPKQKKWLKSVTSYSEILFTTEFSKAWAIMENRENSL
ncbi:VPGUxxT family thioredoxin-like (seleno)protein, type 2 [Aquimarina sp. RZ0]|uniref:VPGUxxT family thioredoxin-like (seleno)protein, type 2 n=1 Tax=Aquimarina sp. RZ0 TaxID=2607730 RepID=UPI0011F21FBC|nr:VPGUxxT family thioredoxin-like (seleno)protein, type 2 [Aquimarina sp. RZ0]KAA1242600.1 thioredoxin family protein [Aquimarina sp. RZ0]